MKPETRQLGFTLIEVIVAVVVAALALTALSGVFSNGLRSAATQESLARLAVVAESVLAQAGLERPIEDGATEGRDERLGVRWILNIQPEPTTDSDNPIRPPLELKRLSVAVFDERSGASSRSFELSTLRAVPRRDP